MITNMRGKKKDTNGIATTRSICEIIILITLSKNGSVCIRIFLFITYNLNEYLKDR